MQTVRFLLEANELIDKPTHGNCSDLCTQPTLETTFVPFTTTNAAEQPEETTAKDSDSLRV